VEHQGKDNQIVDMFHLIAFFVLFSVCKLLIMTKNSITHGVISKIYMGKFKPLI
jgi:hypothetical protein